MRRRRRQDRGRSRLTRRTSDNQLTNFAPFVPYVSYRAISHLPRVYIPEFESELFGVGGSCIKKQKVVEYNHAILLTL